MYQQPGQPGQPMYKQVPQQQPGQPLMYVQLHGGQQEAYAQPAATQNQAVDQMPYQSPQVAQ